MPPALKIIGRIVAALVIIFALAVTIVPRFMDRIYYRGDPNDHFSGKRFFNPGGEDDTGPPGGGGRASFFWNQLTGRDARPTWPDTVPVRVSKPAARVEGDRMVATWVGHATVLVQTAGLNILTDPVWSDRAGPLGFGPKRVTVPGIAFDDLPPIDLVLVSHNHYDHMDVATLKRLWDRDQPYILTSPGNDAILRSSGIEAKVLDWNIGTNVEPARVWDDPIDRRSFTGRARQRPNFSVVVVRNHHWSSRWFTDRNRALWSSFVVRLPSGNVFFAGDTGMGDGKWPAEAAALGPIRLALIPIGAFRFVPGQMSSGTHIGPVQAVEVFHGTGATTAIPIHWGTFRLSYEGYLTPPRLLAAASRCAGVQGFAAVPIGRAVEVGPVRGASVVSTSAAAMARCLDTPAVRALR